MSISTVLRQAVSVEISLSNPLNEELRFLVSLQVSKVELVATEKQARMRLPLHPPGHAKGTVVLTHTNTVMVLLRSPLCLLCPAPAPTFDDKTRGRASLEIQRLR